MMMIVMKNLSRHTAFHRHLQRPHQLRPQQQQMAPTTVGLLKLCMILSQVSLSQNTFTVNSHVHTNCSLIALTVRSD